MGAAGESPDELGTSFGVNLGSAGKVFFTNLLKKCDLCISTPLTHGIAIIAGPGIQVAATWAEKSSPIGPKWPRRGQSEGSGQSSLADRFSLAVKVMDRAATLADLTSSQRVKSI